jgi:transcriptional regulator with XRE-family HTH domain
MTRVESQTPYTILARLGHRIRDVRQRSGMTQDELASALSQRLGTPLSRSTLGNYETGRRPIPAELLLLIADICDVPLQAFALDNSGVEALEHPLAPATANPPVDVTAALTLINQTLQQRPDVVPFVLELIAAFVEEPRQD